jgi:VWFA-related protein
MTRAVPRCVPVLILAALLIAPWTSAQQSPQSQQPQVRIPEQEQPIRVQVQLVNLFATIRDSNRRLVTDLAREELRVFEDGKEQKIEFFRRETDLPLTLGLLIDTSGSEQKMLPLEQEAASRFLHRVLRPGDLAMVISFDVDVDLLSDFTSDMDRLEGAIRRARINAPYSPVTPGPIPPHLQSGGTNFYDALYLACTEKLARETGRKAIIVITDAVDTGSRVRDKEALEACQRTDTVIHVILIADPGFGRDAGTANKFASETGGRVLEPSTHGDMDKAFAKLGEAFDQIAEELRSQYIIGYTPANAARDGAYRKIKLESTRKGLRILTRKGYYAPKS